ncbi:MAG: zf-HC2 domain-containing protein, partial [Gemmatimonadetes bacterium]|nr:zf-HC2 domain-containing protein [Gemmatimonadota bacterium]
TRAALRAMPLLQVPDALIPDGHFEVQLSAYLDGELPTTEYDLVFGHLQDCSR